MGKGDKKMGKKKRELVTAWRACHPDLRSSNGFVWPFPGNQAVAPLPDGKKFTTRDACPQFPGDGLCLAKTWAGAASGGIPAITCLEVTYDPADVLGEDANKVRVSRCQVVSLFDATLLIRDGWCEGQNLVGARLVGARLDGARLDRASLDGARLDGARLVGASLDGARLDGARLVGARLVGASLVGARLVGASLDGASLVGARLDGARLVGARLVGALYDRWTRWPDGFDPAASGAVPR